MKNKAITLALLVAAFSSSQIVADINILSGAAEVLLVDSTNKNTSQWANYLPRTYQFWSPVRSVFGAIKAYSAAAGSNEEMRKIYKNLFAMVGVNAEMDEFSDELLNLIRELQFAADAAEIAECVQSYLRSDLTDWYKYSDIIMAFLSSASEEQRDEIARQKKLLIGLVLGELLLTYGGPQVVRPSVAVGLLAALRMYRVYLLSNLKRQIIDWAIQYDELSYNNEEDDDDFGIPATAVARSEKHIEEEDDFADL